MFESYRRADRLWGIRPLSMHGRPLQTEDGEPLTFATKAEAERFRRDKERGMTNIPRERSESFRRKVLTDRRRRGTVVSWQPGQPREE